MDIELTNKWIKGMRVGLIPRKQFDGLVAKRKKHASLGSRIIHNGKILFPDDMKTKLGLV